MQAFHVFWWNKNDGKDSEDLDVIVVASSITNVLDLFQRDFPERDVSNITNIETMTPVVVME